MSCSQSVWLEECIRKGHWQRFCGIKVVLVVASYFPGTYHHFAVVNSLFLLIPATLISLLFIQIISTLPGSQCQKSHNTFIKFIIKYEIMLWS